MNKKFKQFKLLGVAASVLSLGAFTSCTPSDDTTVTTPNKMISSFSIDASKAKKSFALGEAFDSTGLSLNAVFKEQGNPVDIPETISLDDERVAIDAHEFDSSKFGEYTIYVTFTHNKVVRYASYTVLVNRSFNGLTGIDVSVGVSSYELSNEQKKISITPVLTVKEVGENGVVGAEITDYEVTYYKDGEKLDNLNDIEDDGLYQVWVSKTFTKDLDSFVAKNFAVISVVNNVASIKVNSEDESSVFEQTAGSDVISSTWTYTVTYANGKTEQVSAEDVTTDVNTSSQGDKTATVTFKKTNCKGEEKTVTTSVDYKVNPAEGEADIIKEYHFDASSLATGDITSNSVLSNTDENGSAADKNIMTVMATSSSKVTVDGSTKSFTVDDQTINATQRLKMTGSSAADFSSRCIKLDLDGESTIELFAVSSNGTSPGGDRTISLVDSADESDSNYQETQTLDLIAGSTVEKMEFTASKAGTFYLTFAKGGVNVYYIKVTTTIKAQKSVNLSYSPSDVDKASHSTDLPLAFKDDNDTSYEDVSVTAKADSDKPIVIDGSGKTFNVGEDS